jgi:hypothetical protein
MAKEEVRPGDVGEAKKGMPSIRELQEPIDKPAIEHTWLSGDDPDDPLRKEAAERASRAVERGKPRE